MSEWRGYYICPYKHKEIPHLFFGGGADLVVRASDGLGGMVHGRGDDWMGVDEDILLARYDDAFTEFDRDGH
ncbi:MAG: hypothetical protein AAGE89_06010 [Pseudomonadota bacterium]